MNDNLIKCFKCEREYETRFIYYLEEDGEKKPICVYCKQKI